MRLKNRPRTQVIKDGIQQLTFEDGPRFYKRESEPRSMWRPSITTIISTYMPEGLFNWYMSVGGEFAKKKMIDGGNKGTKFHAQKEANFHMIVAEPDDDIQPYLLSCVETEEQLNVKQITSEGFLLSDKYGCAGSYDGMFQIPNFMPGRELFLGDYKTGYYSEVKCGYQLGAYWGMYKEMFDENCGIVVFDVKKEKTRVINLESIQPAETWFYKFLCAFEAFKDDYRKELEELEWHWLGNQVLEIKAS